MRMLAFSSTYLMKLSTNTLSTREQQVLWRAQNRNAVGNIAKEFGISRTSVEKVMKFEFASRDRRVERALAELNCPGFESFRETAVAVGE